MERGGCLSAKSKYITGGGQAKCQAAGACRLMKCNPGTHVSISSKYKATWVLLCCR